MKYVLTMFPYPSGDGLHLGHAYNYAVMDTYCRWLRLSGEKVFQPFGYDAFGLPAENYARKVGRTPGDVTTENIQRFRGQMKHMRTQYTELLVTSDPFYYRWTQWIFTKLIEHGLAYKAERPEPYCPSCDTVLAKADTKDQRCVRCGSELSTRTIPQWFVRTTAYRDELIAGLDTVDYPEGTKAQQRAWLENLTDWCVSRQRAWGTRIPVEGEGDTLDTFMDSSFYYVRYCDPNNREQLCDPAKYRQVDLCVGGPEHACAHLIYARFIHLFLFKIGVVPVKEPFKKVFHQGMIVKDGAKMSKSLGNVVNPDDYAPDELRMQLMFIGPYNEGGSWDDSAIKGVRRFLVKFRAWLENVGTDTVPVDRLHQQLDERVRALRFNTAVSDWMKFYNQHKHLKPGSIQAEGLSSMLECFAPSK